MIIGMGGYNCIQILIEWLGVPKQGLILLSADISTFNSRVGNGVGWAWRESNVILFPFGEVSGGAWRCLLLLYDMIR
jgi:hypothetical protein